MAKTIEDYKKDYAAAAARGDAAGMAAANQGANAIRAQTGQKQELATQHIANVAGANKGGTTGQASAGNAFNDASKTGTQTKPPMYNTTVTQMSSGKPSGQTSYIDSSGEKKVGYFGDSGGSGYKTYTKGENPELDGKLAPYTDAFNRALASGDPEGMRAANDAANQLRNQYGYAAQYANEIISR